MKTYLFKNPTVFLRYSRQDVADNVTLPLPWELVSETELRDWVQSQPEITRTESFRVSKETMIRRVRDLGKLSNMRALIGTLSLDKQFEFNQLTSFDSNDPEIVNGLTALGLRPGEILAPDPLME